MKIRHIPLLIAAVLLCACKKPDGHVTPPPPGPDNPVTPENPDSPDNPDNPVPSPDGDFIIVGYATYWDTTIPDTSLLTHINYSFAHIENDFETLDLKNESRLAKIAALKNSSPGLKVMLSVGGWEAGNFSKDQVDYNEINFSGYTRSWDSEAMVPYLVNSSGTMVLSYDDETSVGLKADYVKSKGLKGAMYWNIEADDARWTLSKAISSRLLRANEPDATAFLATNEYVQKYMEEVEYTDTDYETTKILDYQGGGPGTADIPPAYTISWTAGSTPQKLTVWEGDWSREYSVSAGTGKQELTYFSPADWSMSTENGVQVYKHTRRKASIPGTSEAAKTRCSPLDRFFICTWPAAASLSPHILRKRMPLRSQ